MQRLKDNKTYRKTTKKTHLLSSVSLIFNKLDTFTRTWADPTTFDGKISCANPTLSNISLILAATTILKKQQFYETRNPSKKKKLLLQILQVSYNTATNSCNKSQAKLQFTPYKFGELSFQSTRFESCHFWSINLVNIVILVIPSLTL